MSKHMQSTYAMHGELVVGRFLFFFPDSVFLFSGSEYSRLTLVCLLFWNLGGTHGNSGTPYDYEVQWMGQNCQIAQGSSNYLDLPERGNVWIARASAIHPLSIVLSVKLLLSQVYGWLGLSENTWSLFQTGLDSDNKFGTDWKIAQRCVEAYKIIVSKVVKTSSMGGWKSPVS